MQAGDVVDDRFEVSRLAATGGMGAVFEALDRQSGRKVALKVVLSGLGESSFERFAREAELMAELSHPAIVGYVAHGSAGGAAYLAMEWLEGEDLAARLSRAGLLPFESATIAIRVAEALSAAHARGVIHRDIKPSNVFLEERDVQRVKLLDFGIAALARADRDLTRTGMTVGTPGYIAPEQARGGGKLDGRVDIFSLGCVLFECLTGAAPFVGDHPVAILAKVLVEDPPSVRDLVPAIPPALAALVSLMLEKDPDRRIRDASAVVRSLQEMLPSLADLHPSPTSARRPGLTKSEHRLVSVIFAAAVAQRVEPVPDEAVAATVSVESLAPSFFPVEGIIGPYGGRAELLADGSIIITFLSRGGVTDQVERAARAALALRELLPSVPLALTTGRSLVQGRAPSGEAIDRAISLTARETVTRSNGVRVDAVTAGLVQRRFDIEGTGDDLRLVGERDGDDAPLATSAPCVGRDRELMSLEALFDQCVDEPAARVVLVVGPAGVGKSRLRRELRQRLSTKTRDLAVWTARGDAMSRGAPLGLIAQIVHEACGIVPSSDLVERRRLVARHVDSLFREPEASRVAAFLGEIADAKVEDRPGLELVAARADAMLMGDQTRRAFEDLIEAETRSRPVLITLDDLQWGDQASVKYVDQLLRQLHDRPLLVVATARPEIDTDFPAVFAERDVEIVRLGELPKRAAESLVRALLGAAGSDELVAQIVERGAGNALYLEELARAVSEGKGDHLPDTVLAMVEARLAGLESDARLTLRAASVFGRVFWRGGVKSLVGALDPAPWLELLAEREIILKRRKSRFADDDEYTFRHALFRESAYAMLTPNDRAAGHALAGSWLEARGEREPLVLAEHFERGGAADKSCFWYERAATHTLEGCDLGGALTLAGKALLGAAGDLRARVLVLMADAHNWRGEFDLAKERARQALALAVPGGPHWFAALSPFAFAAARAGRNDETNDVTEKLLAHAPTPGSYKAFAIAASSAITGLLRTGQRAKADAIMAKLDAIEADATELEPVALPHILSARSWRAMFDGDPYRCLELDIELCDQLAKLGDGRLLAREKLNLGYDLMNLGAYERAEAAMLDALAFAERLGLSAVVAATKHNLGLVLLGLGRLEEAEALERAAMKEIEHQYSAVHAGNTSVYLGLILAAQGRRTEARDAYHRALDLLGSAPAIRAWPMSLLAAGKLDDGDVPGAVEQALAARVALDAGQPEEGEARVRLVHAECLAAAGRNEEALASVEEAAARITKRASWIKDVALRSSFLERIPEHARTFDLLEKLRG